MDLSLDFVFLQNSWELLLSNNISTDFHSKETYYKLIFINWPK